MPPDNSSIFVDGDSEEASNGADSDQLGSNSNSNSNSNNKSEDSWKDCDDEKTTDSEPSDMFSSSEEESSLSKQLNNNAPKATKRLLASATAAAAAVCSIYALEKYRQKKLTKIPLVMGQIPPGSQMESICNKLQTSNGKGEHEKLGGVLNRPIVPSLFVGTNGQLASAAAYLSSGPSSSVPFVVRFSETLVSSYDGAEILLDWEVPNHQHSNNNNNKNSKERGREKKEDNKAAATFRKTAILSGTISHPTILILHGINNSSQYGYIKSLQRTMTDRGWNAVAMNFRGCAKDNKHQGLRNNIPIPMTTPRSYTASYTGDLRSIIHQLTGRMTDHNNNRHQKHPRPSLFLVGNSLGANLVTKYLGEEGLAGTLPRNVVGGVSLGNPFRFRADHIHTLPFGAMMGAARKANYFFQRKAMAMSMPGTTNETNNNNTVHSDPRTITLASLDRVLAPTMIRTVSHPPYETKIGYGHEKSGNSNISNDASSDSAADAYWADSCCYKQGRHVSVPLLHIIARDDNLCYKSATNFMGYSLQNPNVVVVQTRTGGHLGWWHTPSSASSTSSSFWGLNSWADGATADFIQAVMESNSERKEANNNLSSNHQATTTAATIDDAHNLFASHPISSGSDDSSSSMRGTISSMRVLPGDCDDDFTIATNDHSNYNNNNVTNNSSRGIPRAAARSPQLSRTYFQFQQVLVLQQNQQNGGEEKLERNRILEKHESIKLAQLFRSRL
jgi:predicted alpha/beta-fold hydrolase